MKALAERLRRDPGLAAVVVAVLAAIVLYAPTLGRGLVGYDDSYMIADNWVLRDPSWSTLHTVFFDFDSPKRFVLSPEYLPVRDLSIMLDVMIWGDWYPGFHLTNLGIYLAAIVLWFGALDAFGIDRKIAGIAILVWAVHPAHAESVAWLAERKGLLAAMFSGGAALAYARFRSGRGVPWLALGAVASVAAIWSKAPAAFAIAALAALEVALPAKRASWKRALVGLGALGAVSIAAFVPVLHLAASAAVVGTDAHGPAGRLAMVLGVHGFYLKLAAMVISNAVSYPISEVGPSTVDLVLGGLGLVLAVAVAFAPRNRAWSPSDPLRAAVVLWLVTWLPVSHLLLPLQMIVVADRYVLVPTLGLALALAVGLSRISSARARRALITVIVLAAAMRAHDAQSNWRDATTLWQRAVRSNPQDGIAWSAYADALVKAGDAPHAASVASQGLRLSRNPRLLMRKALLLLENGNRKAGVVSMRVAAIAGEPRAMSNLALLLLEDQLLVEALAWARQGAAAMPMYTPANRAHGKVALAAGHAAEAVLAFTRAYELEPQSCTNGYNLALALIQRSRPLDARPLLEACTDDPALGPRVRATLAGLRP